MKKPNQVTEATEKTKMKADTPRTGTQRDKYIQGLIGATDILIAMGELERELNEMRKALKELHVVVECAPGDIIHDWYCTDPLASQVRETALQILNRGCVAPGA